MPHQGLNAWMMCHCLFQVLSAQAPGNWEIRLGAGRPTMYEAGNSLGNSFVATTTLGSVKTEGKSPCGSLFLSLDRGLGARFSLGLLASFERLETRTRLQGGESIQDREKITSLMGRCQWRWKTGTCEIYHGLALGMTHFSVNQHAVFRRRHRTGPALHLTPIGIRYGDSWGFFLETGLGSLGLLNAGISKRF